MGGDGFVFTGAQLLLRRPEASTTVLPHQAGARGRSTTAALKLACRQHSCHALHEGELRLLCALRLLVLSRRQRLEQVGHAVAVVGEGVLVLLICAQLGRSGTRLSTSAVEA